MTGATGFIGNAVCKALDNIPGLSVTRVSRTNDSKDFFYSKDYNKLPVGDVCIHLGEDPDRVRVNKRGEQYRLQTGRVIESILRNGYDYVLYVSSAAVYGTSGRRPYVEEDVVIGHDEYSRGKLDNEGQMLASGAGVVRLANVVGPGMARNNVLSDIIMQLRQDEGPLIVRDAQPIRDFICVYDAVDAIAQLANAKVPGLFNVGTGVETSIHELAKICLQLHGQGQREVVGLSETNLHSYNVVDISKIRAALGWSPSTDSVDSIRQILRETGIV